MGDLDAALDDHVGDDLLRLMFTACHPVLSTEARVALTLRLLGGLTTPEIARAFLVPEPTVAQRIVRAKRTLAEARVPFEVPRGDELAARLVVGARGDLPRVQRGLLGHRRRRLDAARAVRGRAPAGPDPRRARAGRARGARAGGADGDPGVAAAGARRARRASRCCCWIRTAARWDQLLIRRGLAALARARGAGRRARAVRAPGRDRRLPRAGAHGRGDRLGADRRAVRRAGPAHAVAGGGAQPRGRGRDGVRPGGRPRAGGRSSPASPRSRPTTCCRACAATSSPSSAAARRRARSSSARRRSPRTPASAPSCWSVPRGRRHQDRTDASPATAGCVRTVTAA